MNNNINNSSPDSEKTTNENPGEIKSVHSLSGVIATSQKKEMTYEEIYEAFSFINLIPISKNDTAKTPIQDKLTYAAGKTIKELNKHLLKIKGKSQDIEVEHASIDDQGNLLVDEQGRFKHTRENNKKVKALLKAEENKKVMVDLYVCTDLTRVKTLNISLKLALNGILFQIPDHLWEEWENEGQVSATENTGN